MIRKIIFIITFLLVSAGCSTTKIKESSSLLKDGKFQCGEIDCVSNKEMERLVRSGMIF